MSGTKIEWTDETWNPVTGCRKVSEGCRNCYAESMAKRLEAMKSPRYLGLTDENGWTGKINLHHKSLDQPIRWKRPRNIFVNSMSDLFHEDVPDHFIELVFAAMAQAPWHTFQVLTKRPKRMLRWFNSKDRHLGVTRCFKNFVEYEKPVGPWPLPNVWLGVSVEDQKSADERIPLLLKTPAAVRFLSMEPLLERVNLCAVRDDSTRVSMWHPKATPMADLDWVIVGGESGPKARPMHPDWVRTVRDQCQAAEVPFFFKQWGEWEVASRVNGHHGSCMPDSGKRYTWVGIGGETYNPSAPPDFDCWAMAKVGKKAAGSLLDGRTWKEMPKVKT